MGFGREEVTGSAHEAAVMPTGVRWNGVRPATMPRMATHFEVPRLEVTESGSLRPAAGRVRSPGQGEVLLRLRWCGLCGTDLYKLVTQSVPAGTVLGHELVGTVEVVGAGLGFQVGERVVVPHHVACGSCRVCRAGSETQCKVFKENLLEPGGHSGLILVRERAARRAARRVPDGVSDEAVVFLEPAACVLRGIDRAGLPEGEGRVVVVGGGSMGLLHLLVLRAARPELSVEVVEPREDRRNLALELGAHAAKEPGQGLDTAADAVFDTVGGSAVLRESLERLRPGGTVVLFAHAGPGEAAGFELNRLFKAEQRVVATYSGSVREQDRVAELLFSGRLDPLPLVSHRLPFSRASEAVDLALRQQALKILLTPEEA